MLGGSVPRGGEVVLSLTRLTTLGEVDLHLFAEGRHERLWEILGAHPRSFTTPDGVVEGVAAALRMLLEELGEARTQVDLVAYSTTTAMNALLAYLTENCCAGRSCSPTGATDDERNVA